MVSLCHVDACQHVTEDIFLTRKRSVFPDCAKRPFVPPHNGLMKYFWTCTENWSWVIPCQAVFVNWGLLCLFSSLIPCQDVWGTPEQKCALPSITNISWRWSFVSGGPRRWAIGAPDMTRSFKSVVGKMCLHGVGKGWGVLGDNKS